ncbi:MAG: SBBP repeat-containing protein [Candidatus Aminicenantes bacterium]|jgi:hypothetical protein
MGKLISKISFLFVVLIVCSIQGATSHKQENQIQPKQTQLSTQKSSQNLNHGLDYGKIPLYFIPNEGQVDEEALFYVKASRYTLWLTKEGLVFDSIIKQDKRQEINSNVSQEKQGRKHGARDNTESQSLGVAHSPDYQRDVSRMVFLDAQRDTEVIPLDIAEYKVNYFIGDEESKWKTGLSTSEAVLYRGLYKNIDLKVYGVEKEIEYDFIVRPGGEVSGIRFEYRDVKRTEIDEEGSLVIETEFGSLKHIKPAGYQEIAGERIEVDAEFRRVGDNIYGFFVEEYSENYELTIDPMVLVFSTYLGGTSGDNGQSIAVDCLGAAYVTGYTASTDFPTQNPIQASKAGGAYYDVFITKINPSGSALVYSTYLGGSYDDYGYSIAADSSGAAYVTGRTQSTDFPTQNPIKASNVGNDAFITKINPAGSALVYSTYLGGSIDDWAMGIAVDSSGAAYVTGMTASGDFPTQNPIQASWAGRSDVFITKINPSGSALVYSTYLGGSSADCGIGIAVDSSGAAYVTGDTGSLDFPTMKPIQASHAGGEFDVFITKINPGGSALVYSTYFGGSGYRDLGYGIAVDSEDDTYVTGYTYSTDFPTKKPIQASHAGNEDAFIAKLILAWQNLTGDDPELIVSTDTNGDGNEEICADFGALGLWLWRDSWSFLTSNDPEYIISADTDGDSAREIVADFGTLGLWMYDGAGTWTSLAGADSENIIAADTDGDNKDEVVGDFGTMGLWLYDSGAWTPLSGSDADNMIAADADGDSQDEVVGDFGALGLWSNNGGVWNVLAGSDAEGMIVMDREPDGAHEIVADFGASALWIR